MAARLEPQQLQPSQVTLDKSGVLAAVSGRPSAVSFHDAGLSFMICSGECLLVRASRQIGQALQENGVLDKLRAGSGARVIGVIKSSGESVYLQLLEPVGSVELLS